ncbi:MAG: division/cell wall cluster transcriptional repressor MraZ [Cytophagales bacterium]|nr:division/cell wall cluster transcriptional repressor MraZ [Hyphobacterium sp. CCMP332]
MVYFASEYEVKIDAKGRVVLPAKVKANLPQESGTNIVLSRGFEPCLVLRPQSEFFKILEKLQGLNQFDAANRNFQRKMLSGSTDMELDSNGRFLIPKTMMAYAQLEKQAIIVGMGDRVEIWNPKVYDRFLNDDPEEFARMAQEIFAEDPDKNSESLK